MEFLKNKKKLLILIPIFVFLDQLTKQWALKNIFDNQKIIEINQYLNFTPVWNRGISFGMFSNVEGINFYIKTKEVLIVNWFDSEVVVLNSMNLNIKKRITVGEGPRGFGNFIGPNLTKNENIVYKNNCG